MSKARQLTVVILLLLPLISHLTERGASAFTMYATSVWFRVEIVAHDADGLARPIPPTSLAGHVGPSAALFFAGADHFRRTYGSTPARHRLADIAALACSLEQSRPPSIEVALFERTGVAGPIAETRERVACTP